MPTDLVRGSDSPVTVFPRAAHLASGRNCCNQAITLTIEYGLPPIPGPTGQ
jgi:hypothetical protein